MAFVITPHDNARRLKRMDEERRLRTRGKVFIALAVVMALPVIPVELASLGWKYGSRFDFDWKYDWSIVLLLAAIVPLVVGTQLFDKARRAREEAAERS